MNRVTRGRSVTGTVVRLWVLAALLMTAVPGGLVSASAAPGALQVDPDIYGTITDADTGEPVEGAFVGAYYMDWPPWERGPNILGETVTGPDGTYAFTGVEDLDAEENFWVDVYADGYVNTRVLFARPDETPLEVDVALEPGELSVHGTVTDADTGEALQGAQVIVEFWIDDDITAWARDTDETGSFGFWGLPADLDFEVWVWADGYEPSVPEPYHYNGVDPVWVSIALAPVVLPNPHFNVDPVGDAIWGHEWPADAEITVTIGEEAVPDFEATVNADGQGDFGLWDLDGYDIMSGEVVTATDGMTTKTHVVTELLVLGVDPVADTVYGTAEQGSQVSVMPDDEGAPSRVVTADSATGAWLADFSVPGGEGEHVFNIEAGTSGNADQRDVDGDATLVRWCAPPIIEVSGVTPGGLYDAPVTPVVTFIGADDTLLTLNGAPFVSGTVIDEAGVYTLYAWAADAVGNESEVTVGFTIELEPGLDPGAHRVEGSNRYLTSIEASKRGFPDGAKVVVLAKGTDWPDALGGSALAGAVDGPLLLTREDALPYEVAREMRRLGATTVYVLGSEASISSGVVRALQDMGLTVNRRGGANRYETARLVAAETIKQLGSAYEGHAFVATGLNFPDAAAVAPVAAGLGRPILLANVTAGTVDVPTATSKVVILGSTAAVPASVESYLNRRLGSANVDRVGGLNRYATAAMIAQLGVDAGMRWDGTGLATGLNFPDALSGGAMLGKLNSVMLLTRPDVLAGEARTKLYNNRAVIDTLFIFGDTNAVSAAVEAAAKSAATVK